MEAAILLSDIDITVSDGVAEVVLNRPARLNAINHEMHTQLADLWRRLSADDTVRVAILMGAGRAFSAGGDSSGFAALKDGRQRTRSTEEARQIFHDMLWCRVPIIAAVNGPAVGLGCTLALLSDIVLASPSAYFSDAHIDVGFVPGDGGGPAWLAAVGVAKARYYLLTGERISATDAERIGLIAGVVEADELLGRARELARQMAGRDAATVAATKRLINLDLIRSSIGSLDYGQLAEDISIVRSIH
jgi:enoyl-CoA hydratase